MEIDHADISPYRPIREIPGVPPGRGRSAYRYPVGPNMKVQIQLVPRQLMNFMVFFQYAARHSPLQIEDLAASVQPSHVHDNTIKDVDMDG
ncbi:Snurportin 1 [Musa troglodytarum]|uniref:Snurportin 1 n=1 Tax=Musa troglodytarum TaxID=320322 RepID=A0A9E7K9M9_9LILI|nr:Snurportin 1 [Musa troglodytarum]